MNNIESSTFTIREIFYCQWSGGAKEYFQTLEEAINHAKSHYQRKDHWTDENFTYWQKQQFAIGKEATIVQHISLITNNLPVS